MSIPALDVAFWRDVSLGLSLEHVYTPVNDATIAAAEVDFAPCFAAMDRLEAGDIANPDEQRRVGHYWLRAPDRAPDGLGPLIRDTVDRCRSLAMEIHRERQLRTVLVLGIGGSALGPQFVSDALGEPQDAMRVCFIDNTDPDGMARILGPLDLEETLTLCISKSGGTAETRNALIETEAAYARAGVSFAERAIAITGEGSVLWHHATAWRARLPMWDWVGGRTSVTSAVGLLPMFLQGIDADALLDGAAAMDEVTRQPSVHANPAARLALLWHHLAPAAGHPTPHVRRAMVMLPYRDRLVLLSRYLQQLVMESIGKERDLAGAIVHQGLTVYGNKGSTDQHAYVQQLRDGPDDHFVTFVAVEDDGDHEAVEVDPGVDSGDYLQGFRLGTRKALAERGHPSFTLGLARLDAFHIGALIALYERAVGLYAARIGVNAYHQPGVEAGKKAAGEVIAAKGALLGVLDTAGATASELATRAGLADMDTAWSLLTRLAANRRGVQVEPGATPGLDRFSRMGE